MGAALHLCSVVLRSGCQLPVADRPAEAFPFHDAFLGRTDRRTEVSITSRNCWRWALGRVEVWKAEWRIRSRTDALSLWRFETYVEDQPAHGDASRFGFTRGRRRFGQAVSHAIVIIHLALHVLPDHADEDV